MSPASDWPPDSPPYGATLRSPGIGLGLVGVGLALLGLSCGDSQPLDQGHDVPPSVQIVVPAGNSTLPLLVDTAIVAAAQDSDGQVRLVEFFDGATRLGQATTAPFRLGWTPGTPGAHSLTARATDNGGKSTTSAPVTVTVVDAAPQVVLTAPASGTSFLVNTAVQLTATASDPDGAVARVEFLDGATLLGSDDTAPYGLTWTPSTPGGHTLTARATDAFGVVTTSAPVAVTITATNIPPTVALTAPAAGDTLPVNLATTLTATAGDADGSVAAVQFYDGLTLLGTDSAAPYTLSWTPAVPGSHALSARAVDNQGAVSASAPVTVTVIGPVTATILTPLAGTIYHAGDTIQYSGTGTDANGAPLPGSALTWWVDLHHDTHIHPFLLPTTGSGGSVVVPTIGETSANVWLRFYLRAVGASGTADTVFREIFPQTVTLTILSVPAGRTITLDGQPHVTPYSVAGVVGMQRQLGAPSPQSSVDSAYAFQQWSDGGAATHTITTPGGDVTYTATFLATGPANRPPTVALTSPANGSSVVVNTTVSLSATAADSDGTVARVEFLDGATVLGADSSAPFGLNWTPTVVGSHSLTARATDNGGATATSTAVSVSVTSQGGGDTEAPTIDLTAPADGTQDLTGVVTASATATDNVGVAGVEFQFDGQSLGEDTSAPYQMALPASSGFTTGVHQVRARARDAAGNRSPWAVARITFGGSVDLPTGFARSSFVQGLGGTATAMTFAPDGRLFICEQGGDLRVVKNGVLLPTPFVTVPTTANGERGLLGVAFHPNFPATPYVYVYYTTATPNNRISRFTASGDTAVPGSEHVIVELPTLSSATNHNGGAIHFGPDGKLYVAVGDNADGTNSQSDTTRLGKMLRYNDDGSIPADNPTLGTGVNRAIWAKGLRNPFTFGFRADGRLFINDVGETTWEEINEGIAGANYGWPLTEGPTSNPAFTGPLFAYGHGGNPTLVVGGAIVGAAFYNPPTVLFPSGYVGSYFFADYVDHWVNRMDLPTDTGAIYAFARLPASLTDLAVGPDGALYVLGVQADATWGVWRISH